MKRYLIAFASVAVLGAAPVMAASSSNRIGGSHGASNAGRINPGARIGSPGYDAGAMAPNTGPGSFQNRTRFAPTAPPVPGSAQDPYGNSARGSSTGTSGSGQAQ